MNQNERSVSLIRNGGESNLESSYARFFRSGAPALLMLLALAIVPAPRAAETQLSIRITPRAAEMIAARERDMTPAIVSASLPAPGSNTFFAQSCKAAGGTAVVAQKKGFKRLICV